MKVAKLLLAVMVLVISLSVRETIQAQNTSQKSQEKELVKKIQIKKMVAAELERNRAQLNFKDVDPGIFKRGEIDKLASGVPDTQYVYRYIILKKTFPLVKTSEVYLVNVYVNINGVISLSKSWIEIGSEKTTIDISILSFLLPLIFILAISIFSAFNLPSYKKINATIFIVLANVGILGNIFLGVILGWLISAAVIWLVLLATLVFVVIFLEDTSKLEKIILISAMPVEISLGIHTGQMIDLGFSLFSPQMAPIWESCGLYVAASIVGLMIMWLIKSREDANYISQRT